jgi:hypothetical protein
VRGGGWVPLWQVLAGVLLLPAVVPVGCHGSPSAASRNHSSHSPKRSSSPPNPGS